MAGRAAIFLDRDGVINRKAPEGQYIVRPNQVRLMQGTGDAIARLNAAGYLVVVITNQRAIGKGLMSEADFWLVMECIKERLNLVQAHLDAIYFCPDIDDQSPCRKPNSGMIKQALRDFPDIALDRSWMVGDSVSDQECAIRAGLRCALVKGSEVKLLDSSQDVSAISLSAFVDWLLQQELHL